MEKKLVAECEAYAKEYMDYLSVAKTERRAYVEAVRRLDAAGFKDLATVKSLKPGDKVYRGYHGKTLMACVIGSAPCAEGLRVVGGHIDSPRLDLKPRPLYARGGIVYFDTRMYGGIKKFQWLVHPLALYGVIVRKDGTKAEVAVGDRPGDPVFMISDILPHFGRDQESKSQRDFYPAEDLDVIAGTLPVAGKDGEKTPAAKQALVEFLKKEYNVTEEDLLSAELEIVPAGMPREVGFDRRLRPGRQRVRLRGAERAPRRLRPKDSASEDVRPDPLRQGGDRLHRRVGHGQHVLREHRRGASQPPERAGTRHRRAPRA